MKLDIKKVSGYLIALSNEEIMVGDWYLFNWSNEYQIERFSDEQLIDRDNNPYLYKNSYRKIVAHLPLGQSPIISDLSLLPNLDQSYYNDNWSEEDVRRAILSGFMMGVERRIYSDELEDEIIQMIKEGKNSSDNIPIEFECQTIWINSLGVSGDNWGEIALYEDSIGDFDAWLVPKKVDNILVGNWIY